MISRDNNAANEGIDAESAPECRTTTYAGRPAKEKGSVVARASRTSCCEGFRG